MPTSVQRERTTSKSNPKIVISANDLPHLEHLADGMMQNQPALAERLLGELARARIVIPAKMPKNVVGMGSAVTYRDESTGREKTVMLVYPEEADIGRMRVSVMTPIGVALLGLAEGASLHWDTRGNERRILTILNVRQPPPEG